MKSAVFLAALFWATSVLGRAYPRDAGIKVE